MKKAIANRFNSSGEHGSPRRGLTFAIGLTALALAAAGCTSSHPAKHIEATTSPASPETAASQQIEATAVQLAGQALAQAKAAKTAQYIINQGEPRKSDGWVIENRQYADYSQVSYLRTVKSSGGKMRYYELDVELNNYTAGMPDPKQVIEVGVGSYEPNEGGEASPQDYNKWLEFNDQENAWVLDDPKEKLHQLQQFGLKPPAYQPTELNTLLSDFATEVHQVTHP